MVRKSARDTGNSIRLLFLSFLVSLLGCSDPASSGSDGSGHLTDSLSQLADAAPHGEDSTPDSVGKQCLDAPGSVEFEAATVAKLEAALAFFSGKVPGATLAVVLGERRWTGAFGKSNLWADTNMVPGNLFKLASVSKTYIAATVLLLEEAKLLSIEDKLSKWIPDFPNGDNILLYQLMNHTSGIYNYIDDPSYSFTTPTTPEKVIEVATGHDPLFAPGTSWSYSNTNYILLGMVIEAAAQTFWPSAIRQRLLDLHGLQETFSIAYESYPNDLLVRAYDGEGTTWSNVTNAMHPSQDLADGGLIATAADLARFSSLLHGGQIISATSLQKMRETYTANVKLGLKYGLGLQRWSVSGGLLYGHGGALPGVTAVVRHDSTRGVSIVLLANATAGTIPTKQVDQFFSQLFKLF